MLGQDVLDEQLDEILIGGRGDGIGALDAAGAYGDVLARLERERHFRTQPHQEEVLRDLLFLDDPGLRQLGETVYFFSHNPHQANRRALNLQPCSLV